MFSLVPGLQYNSWSVLQLMKKATMFSFSTPHPHMLTGPARSSMVLLQVCAHAHTRKVRAFIYCTFISNWGPLGNRKLNPGLHTNTHSHTSLAHQLPHQYSIYWVGYFEVARTRAWQFSPEIKTILSWFLPHSRERRKLSVIVCFYYYSPFAVWVFTGGLKWESQRFVVCVFPLWGSCPEKCDCLTS